jgi:glycosyltransferase involved in cell wall biosynthesis
VLRAYRRKKLEDKILVIPYAFDPSNWLRSDNPTIENLQIRDINIGTIARLEKQKNLDGLIKALSILNDSKFRLHIAGVGSEYTSLQALARELKIADQISFVGKITDVKSFLDSLDTFVLPTHYEGFGIVLIEASARRIPIVASDLAVCREVLGSSGAIYCDPTNPTSIAKAIARSCENPIRSDVRNHASQRIHNFTLEALRENIKRAYSLGATR